MIDFNLTEGLITALCTAIGSAVTFYVGRHTRTKSAVESLQSTIDSLVAKNAELYDEIVSLRQEVAEFKAAHDEEMQRRIVIQKELDEIKRNVKKRKN